jgi:two-component system, cell cycle sensor histidine kinase and response regulator CckA
VVDVAQAIEETREMLRPTLGERFQLHAPSRTAKLPAVRIDPGQLSQVLVNLVVNARDAMPEGGEILVEADVDEIDDADAAQRPRVPPGRYVRITVSDPGSGMHPPVASRAFEPFFTTKPTGEGTGLGLATVHGIVSRAGGYVELDSEPGRGTDVSALLPAAARDAPAEVPERLRREDGGRGRVVLVVEDEPAVRALTRRILTRHGYQSLEAADGAEALEVCRRHGEEIDLLLTDVIMPAMSGRELAERVREDWPRLPVLYMSGYPGDVIEREGVQQGSLKLIQKPFSPESLLEAVDAALSSGIKARS